MNSILQAMHSAGLVGKHELEEVKPSATTAQQVKDFWKGKPVETRLASARSFFDRIATAVEILEEGDPNQICPVIYWCDGHLSNGEAGKEFVAQLLQFELGKLSLPDIKKKWPKVFQG